jgi:hypothetical protein
MKLEEWLSLRKDEISLALVPRKHMDLFHNVFKNPWFIQTSQLLINENY